MTLPDLVLQPDDDLFEEARPEEDIEIRNYESTEKTTALTAHSNWATLPNDLHEKLLRGRDLLPRAPSGLQLEEPLLPTRISSTDRLLAGGLARGEMVEVVGWRSSGRFSLLLSTLAAATQAGELAALIDLGDHLDPEVAELAGIDLERLLWARPQHLKAALGCAELLVNTGFPLVVLDLGTPPVPGGRGSEAGWLRLQRAAQTFESALLISAPYRASGTAAQAVLELQRGYGRWMGGGRSQRLLGGLDITAELAKVRLPRLRDASRDARASAPEIVTLRWASGGVEGFAEPLQPRRPLRAQRSEGAVTIPFAPTAATSITATSIAATSSAASSTASSSLVVRHAS